MNRARWVVAWVKCALVLWGCLAWAARGRADTFVIAPPVHQGTDGSDVAASIVAVALRELGAQHQVLSPEQAVATLPADQRTWCGSSECLERYRVAARADAALAVRVYRMAGGKGPASSFDLGLQRHPGLEFRLGAVLDPAQKLEAQVTSVIRDLERQYRDGPGPHLSVTGAPRDASVFVDGERKATGLPAFLTVGTGDHLVTVEATGFEPKTRFVSLQSATALESLDMRLEPARAAPRRAAGPLATPEARELPPPWTRRAKLALALGTIGAAAMLGGTVYTVGSALQQDGHACLAHEGPFCGRRSSGDHEARQVAIGASVIGAGLAATIAGIWLYRREQTRVRADVSVGKAHAALVLRRAFR
jgi:hypothetical protein